MRFPVTLPGSSRLSTLRARIRCRLAVLHDRQPSLRSVFDNFVSVITLLTALPSARRRTQSFRLRVAVIARLQSRGVCPTILPRKTTLFDVDQPGAGSGHCFGTRKAGSSRCTGDQIRVSLP